MTRRFALVLLAAVAAACSEAVAPIEPVWGKVPCASCGMIVGDRRFAAQLLAERGDRYFYDDLGCLVHHLDEKKPAVAGMWVREAAGDRWLPARAARYVKASAHTPMDFGFEARADEGVPFDAFAQQIREKRSR
jgi:copper chaperone NosL